MNLEALMSETGIIDFRRAAGILGEDEAVRQAESLASRKKALLLCLPPLHPLIEITPVARIAIVCTSDGFERGVKFLRAMEVTHPWTKIRGKSLFKRLLELVAPSVVQ